MKKLIVSVRVNEYKQRSENPHVPFTPDEIAEAAAECRKAGASIVHFHARNPDGSACFDPEMYAECAAKIRERSDILIDVTLGQANVTDPEQRIAHIRHMARSPRTRLDFAAVDTGSTNVDAYDSVTRQYKSTNRSYVNSIDTCRFLIREMRSLGVTPAVSAWSIPFLRGLDSLMDSGELAEPTSVQIVLCDGGILGGHPNTPAGLLSMVEHLPRHRKLEWMVAVKEGNIFVAAAIAIGLGGHISPGLGDYAYPELDHPSNARLVEHLVALGRGIGRTPASPDEARKMLLPD